MKKLIPIYLLLTHFLVSCEEPYYPEVEQGDQNLLVIEGELTDSTVIRLSRSTPLNESGYRAESGALVWVEDRNGQRSRLFSESAPGVYAALTPITADEEYRLRIELNNGDEVLSDWVRVMAAQPIDQLYYEIVAGKLQILLDSESDGPSGYYRWTFEETWEYSSAYYTKLQYVNGQLESRPHSELIHICYQTLASSSIEIGSTVDLARDVVTRQMIQEIDPLQSLRLKKAYSILVQQQRLSEEAFEFWRILKNNTEGLGSIFDAQPSKLPSNYTLNGTGQVIGFLSAAKFSKKRIFIDRIDLPFDEFYDPFLNCQLDTVPSMTLTMEDAFGSGDYLPVQRISGGVLGSGKSCVDCRELGGVTEKPAFWIL